MTFNPLKLLELKSRYPVFRKEHPDMPDFGKALNRNALTAGSVFTIRAVTPDGKVIEKDVTLTENDVQIVRLFVGE